MTEDRPRLKKRVESSNPPFDIPDGLPLHLAYRPQTLEQVVGHDAVVKSLTKVLTSASPPHAFLFTGNAGLGKTTLARITASTLKIPQKSVLEIDAATHAAVDLVRQIIGTVAYPQLGSNPLRAVIVDECQAISKVAWQTLLKPIEEPPKHAFWLFCTTEPDRVPATIKSRCHRYHLNPISEEVLLDFITVVAEQEKYNIGDDALTVISEKSDGSPRQALQYLSMCRDCTTRKRALNLIDKSTNSTAVIDLARLLSSGRGVTWRSLRPLLVALANEDIESVRLIVSSFLTTVLLGCTEEARARYLLEVLSNFETPFPTNMRQAPLLLACGRCMMGEQNA